MRGDYTKANDQLRKLDPKMTEAIEFYALEKLKALKPESSESEKSAVIGAYKFAQDITTRSKL
jgi:uncharacterized protein YbcC (UPF0753/DUF2309 family)